MRFISVKRIIAIKAPPLLPPVIPLSMNYLFPLLAVLIWSVNTVVSKLASSSIHPAEIGFLRWVLAAALLTPFLLPGVVRNWRAIRP